MRFSQLIASLQQGSAGLQDHQLAEDPELLSGASLDQAKANQLSFLEQGNALTTQLSHSKVGACLLYTSDAADE